MKTVYLIILIEAMRISYSVCFMLILKTRNEVMTLRSESVLTSNGATSKFESCNYYDILGLLPNANFKQIKEAFRSRAKECHPDKCESVYSLNRFYELQTAYSVLSDRGKRSTYDQKLDLERMTSSINRGDWLPAVATFSKMVAVHIAFPLAKGFASVAVSGLKQALGSTQKLLNEEKPLRGARDVSSMKFLNPSSIEQLDLTQRTLIETSIQANGDAAGKIANVKGIFRSNEALILHQLIISNYQKNIQKLGERCSSKKISIADSVEATQLSGTDEDSAGSVKNDRPAVAEVDMSSLQQDSFEPVANVRKNDVESDRVYILERTKLKRYEVAARVKLLQDHLSRYPAAKKMETKRRPKSTGPTNRNHGFSNKSKGR